MEFEDKYAQLPSSVKRPNTLNTLCLLSFFFSGSMALFSFGGMFFSGWLANYLHMMEKGFHNFGAGYFFLFFLGLFIMFASSFTGALLMFKMKRSGLWIYISANCIMLFLAFFVTMNPFNVLFIIGTVLFLILYLRQAKLLK